jgi:hypothetical protein
VEEGDGKRRGHGVCWNEMRICRLCEPCRWGLGLKR